MGASKLRGRSAVHVVIRISQRVSRPQPPQEANFVYAPELLYMRTWATGKFYRAVQVHCTKTSKFSVMKKTAF